MCVEKVSGRYNQVPFELPWWVCSVYLTPYRNTGLKCLAKTVTWSLKHVNSDKKAPASFAGKQPVLVLWNMNSYVACCSSRQLVIINTVDFKINQCIYNCVSMALALFPDSCPPLHCLQNKQAAFLNWLHAQCMVCTTIVPQKVDMCGKLPAVNLHTSCCLEPPLPTHN